MIDIKDKAKIIQFIFVWIVYAALHTFAVLGIMHDIPLDIVLVHSVARSFLLGILMVLLNMIFVFGNYGLLPVFQWVINCITLLVLMLTAFLGVGYLVDYLFFGNEIAIKFISLYPFYGLIGLLIFFIVLLINIGFKAEEDIADETFLEKEELDETDVNEVELLERIAVKSGQKIHVILVGDIVFLQADGDYVQIHTGNGKFLKEQTMKYFQERLPSQRFVRVHRSAIVNIEQISRIELFQKQNQLITLKNGEKIKMSATGYKSLRQVLGL